LSVAPNSGVIFFCLKPFEERNKPDLSGPGIAQALNAQFAGIEEAFVLTVMPPPVMGLGMIGGFKLFVEDRAGLGYDELYRNTQALVNESHQKGELGGAFSTFTVNVPQLDAEIDRVKAKSQGVPLQNLFETMQVYLGSLYVNDFNLFGRTYQVVAQADAPFRDRADDITKLKTRNAAGQMVPLGTLVKVQESNGPDRAMRYNGYAAAEINGGAAPGFSSGQAEAAMQDLAKSLPKGMAFEWTDLTYQRILAGNTAIYVYPLCILLVFLVLAAQYESFRLPLAIILVVPLCLLFAIAGVWLMGGDNNIFTQIGFIVLIGLACKNAILIVEFAKHKQDEEGLSPFDAAIEACRLRLRPILMTSIAFIAGVFPLVKSQGAGAEMRQAMGVAVFAGMIGVTLFGLFLTPVFYVVLMKLGWRKKPTEASREKHGPASGAIAGTAAVLILGALVLTGCAIGPDYKRPVNAVPATYKSAGATNELGAWKEGQPLDNVPKGAWWEVFGDNTLSELEQRASTTNQELKAAVARVEQARASARVARSEFLPTLDANPSWRRERYSPNQEPSFGAITANTIRAPLDLSYEIDLWGRVRRSFESARADAQGSLAAMYNVLLTLQADLAQNYFSLRSLDAEIATVRGTLGLRHEQLKLTRSRFEGGISSELDMARAETEVAGTEADVAALMKRRAELENAIAVLVGENPTNFKLVALKDANWNPQPPKIPAGLPAALLERRPDVADAERQLASANARIGMAKAAFFPVVRLTGSGGFVSGDIESLFNWESRVWSLGPSISLPIFAGGRNAANLTRSRAAYEEAVAGYRQRVLVAFGEVETSLSGLQFLGQRAAAQDRAVASARRAADLAQQRYTSGIVSYLEVVDASRGALFAERNQAQIVGERLIASVQLMKALGGGWHQDALRVVSRK
jgi:NodT family efflux transporter outer membrane factor (OMF) lipoprotein